MEKFKKKDQPIWSCLARAELVKSYTAVGLLNALYQEGIASKQDIYLVVGFKLVS